MAVNILKEELDQERKNVRYWREEMEKLRKFYDQKINEKNRLLTETQDS